MAGMELGQAYNALGIRALASEAEVRAAYQTIATLWHPERHRGNAAMMRQCEDKLRQAGAAFEVIRAAGFPTPPPPPQGYGQPYAQPPYAQPAYGQMPYVQQQGLPFPPPPPNPTPPRDYSHGGAAIGLGAAVLVLGIAITAGTYDNAVDSGGGTYIIAYGPIVFGIAWIVKGLASLGRKHP
jgi:DnaJ domain